jgi:hypothetical protein
MWANRRYTKGGFSMRVVSYGRVDTEKLPTHPIPTAALQKVPSAYGYFSGYKPGVVGIADQVNRLKRAGVMVGTFNERVVREKLPPHSEGWFIRPSWEMFAPTYSEAVAKVLELLRRNRGGKFYNYREGSLEYMDLHQTRDTETAFTSIQKKQGSETIILPAQFGIYYRGHSSVLVEEEVGSREFLLDTYTVGIMLLSHPARLGNEEDLGIICGGDTCVNVNSDTRDEHTPHFIWNAGQLVFGTGNPLRPLPNFGIATGFTI